MVSCLLHKLAAASSLACIVALLVGARNTRWIFARGGDHASCVPAHLMRRNVTPAPPMRAITAAEIAAFQRDGSVILRGVVSPAWQARYHALGVEVFEHSNWWDIAYTAMVAKFYCAQKSIFMHQTSRCGREIAVAAPTTHIAAALLPESKSLFIIEPSEVIANTNEDGGCGEGAHTGWHTDEVYMGVRRINPKRASVIRLWMPLARFDSRHMQISVLNNSAEARAARAAHNVSLVGTNYETSERLERADGGKLVQSQLLDTSSIGRGDVIVFDDEAPHLAIPHNCSRHAGHCLRLILAFGSGDNALFAADRKTTMLPIGDNQTDGQRPAGPIYPTIYPHTRSWEWEVEEGEDPGARFQPSARAIFTSIYAAMTNGPAAFKGSSWIMPLRYFWRVVVWAIECFWGYGEHCSNVNVIRKANGTL